MYENMCAKFETEIMIQVIKIVIQGYFSHLILITAALATFEKKSMDAI